MEAPKPPESVVPFAEPILPSRPGPDRAGEGVFQPQLSGKYSLITANTLPDVCSPYSATFTNCNVDHAAAISIETSNSITTAGSDNQRTAHSSSNCANDNVASSRRRFLSIYYQNVRGLRTKTSELKLGLSNCEYDVVILTET